MEDIYFCLYLTENEHFIVNDNLSDECGKLGCNLLYYRKLKDWHVPMYREVKIQGMRLSLNKMKKYIENNLDIVRNPHKIES